MKKEAPREQDRAAGAQGATPDGARVPLRDDQRPAPLPRPANHILSIAGTMLGVTTTLIGLIKLIETQTKASRVDEMAGAVVIVFLFAAVTSYASIRAGVRTALSQSMERLADAAFVIGLASLAVLAVIFAWEVI